MKLLSRFILLFCLCCTTSLNAQTELTVSSINMADSNATNLQKPKKDNFIKRFIKEFDNIDTTFITPNKYNWAFMLQNTNSFETYTLHSRELGQRLSFSPKPTVKIGPYFGWRWIFLGYTFELSSLGEGQKSQKTEFELSLYSSMLGCDLIYRRTGNDFRLRKVSGVSEKAKEVEGETFEGINVNVMGINAYYIFNHRRFSYPAAFAQSTVQRKSCGTWKAGFSYTQHELEFDYAALPKELTDNSDTELSQDFRINKLKYHNFSLSCGYAYNWVFKKNWLLCVSVTPALGYKITDTNVTKMATIDNEDMPKFDFNNFCFDVTGRVGLVWNNTKYFGGLSMIVHNYNYRHKKLTISNTFGTINLYLGLNFHKRKAYR